jgi:DNA invertase Pin-like site-specific DNA recombinase
MTETDDRQHLRLLLAARASRKVTKDSSIGIETQDQRGREWAERQGHTIVAVVADYKSGSVAPWDRPNLKPWVRRPNLMQDYDGILAYRNDRLSRGSREDETRIRQWASQNGKVLVIVDGPQWPPRDDGDFWSWTAQAKQAHAEWVEIRERSMRAQGELRARGKLVGRPPWGYEPTGEKYNRTIVPTDEGRKFIPQIYERIADGDSLMTVARWLTAQHAKPQDSESWSPRTVSRIIRNRTYMGARLDAEGHVILEAEALVDAKLWDRANKRLDNSPRGRRTPVSGKSALLTGCLFCPRCPRNGKHAPMYRIHAWGGYFYRCAGHFPQRKGCGNLVPLGVTDAAVTALLSMAREPWKELRPVEGENHDIELAEIRIALDDLPKRNLPDADEDAERARLRAERNRLEGLPNIPDHWEEVDTGKTVGQHFTRLDFDGQRAMMLENVKLYAELGPSNPELSKLAGKPYPVPILRMESRLFRMPVQWIGEQASQAE